MANDPELQVKLQQLFQLGVAECISVMEAEEDDDGDCAYLEEAECSSPSPENNGHRPRIRYERQELLNFQFSVKKEVQLHRWNQVLARLGPIATELYGMDKLSDNYCRPGRKNKNKRDRARKNKQNITDVNNGSLLVIKSEEQCYEELYCSELLGVKAAEIQQSSNRAYEENDIENSEDDFDGLLKPAFFVEGEPDFSSGPPQDGLEYLRRVRWEAAQFPRVKVANVDVKKLSEKQTSYMPNIPPVLDCLIDFLPSKDWEREFLVDFSNLRMALSKIELSHGLQLTSLPSRRDKAGWERFCFGAQCRLSSDEESCSQAGENEKANHDIFEDLDITGTSQECQTKDTSNSYGKDPRDDSLGEIKYAASSMLPVLLSLDEVARATIFRYHVSWLESVSSLSKDRAVWLFSLFAVLDKPLDADTSASVRALLRKCASLRASKSKEDDELSMLNILITIAGKYFGQAEDLLSNSTTCNWMEVTVG